LERVMVEERLRGRDWSLVEKAAGEMDKLRMEIQADGDATASRR